MRARAIAAAIVAIAVLMLLGMAHGARTAEREEPNDNRDPTGALRAGVLTLAIDARVGEWHPDGDDAPGAPVPAFAEPGRAPQIPGPLVRVASGTDLPAAKQVVVRARHELHLGETFDVELTPDTPGDLRLEMRIGGRQVNGPVMAIVPVRVVR